MVEYYQVWLSAETGEEARAILETLVRLKLVVGGTILNGPSRFWWKGDEVDMDYFYVMGFTVSGHREAIEEEFAKVSKEEVPMVAFVKMEGNREFLEFIKESV